MKTTTTLIVGIIISLIVGGAVGYISGSSMGGDSGQAKKLEDSVAMMKEQASSIQKMAETMKSAGMMMQEIGVQDKNEETISAGKDLQAMGEKYIAENKKAAESTGNMNNLMGN